MRIFWDERNELRNCRKTQEIQQNIYQRIFHLILLCVVPHRYKPSINSQMTIPNLTSKRGITTIHWALNSISNPTQTIYKLHKDGPNLYQHCQFTSAGTGHCVPQRGFK
jgi:hypothetical protein